MHASRRNEHEEEDAHAHDEFAMPFMAQLNAVTVRIFQQYWRMPSYVTAKWMLAVAAGLFIGFTFYAADGSLAGIQNVIFSVFMLTTIFSTLVQQVSRVITRMDHPLTPCRFIPTSSRSAVSTRFESDLRNHTRGRLL
jgi:hypothetical protein